MRSHWFPIAAITAVIPQLNLLTPVMAQTVKPLKELSLGTNDWC